MVRLRILSSTQRVPQCVSIPHWLDLEYWQTSLFTHKIPVKLSKGRLSIVIKMRGDEVSHPGHPRHAS